MYSIVIRPALLGIGLLLALGVAAQAQVFVYPQKGQSKDQQAKDEFECHRWAVQQTGVDPTRQSASGYTESAPEGGALRGAGRGAAIGAIGGAIGGNAGKGAAIGAAVGGIGGGIRRRRWEEDERQKRAAAQQQQQGNIGAYNRAFGACLEGRGYTVR